MSATREQSSLRFEDLGSFGGAYSELHELKCDPEPFQAMRAGAKRYELRVNDRGFAVGDVLHLREHNSQQYTGAELACVVTYMTPGGAYGLPSDMVCMSIASVREVVRG